MEQYKEMSKLFRDTADIIDELIELDEKEKTGEDNTEHQEVLLGKFMVKMVQLNALGNR